MPHEDRSPYDPDDLKRLFAALEVYAKSTVGSKRPERFWLPWLALYTGARENELAQLYVEDVRQEEGVWVIDINDRADKRLKNTASRRLFPIHPKLVEMGFLEYVEKLRASGVPRLWPRLKRYRDGYAHDFARWFQAFNREKVTLDPKKVFHSFRHNVGDALFKAGVDEAIRAKILGHAHGTVTTGTYTGGNHLEALEKALRALPFREHHGACEIANTGVYLA